MATVYLAIQENFERQVALKVMSPSLSTDQNFTERFIREARINSRLIHPNIVTVHDVGVQNGHHYLAMEYIDGHDLKENLYSVSGEQVLQLLKDVALALGYAGQKGYVHRDVKLENIMVRSEDGRAVLMDFGIARAIEGSASEAQTGHSLTQSGMSLGTPHYMSPEQVKGLSIDSRSDIYSLGVLFYYLLVKKPPFQAESLFAVGVKHITEDIPQLPDELKVYQPLIERMMAKLPEDRIQTGAEVVAVLDSIDVGPIDDWVAAHKKEFEEEHIRARTLNESEHSARLQREKDRESIGGQGFSGSLSSSGMSGVDSSDLGTILAPPKSFGVQPHEVLHIPPEDIPRRAPASGKAPSKMPWIVGASLLLVVAIGAYWLQGGTKAERSDTSLVNQDAANSDTVASTGNVAGKEGDTPLLAEGAAATSQEKRLGMKASAKAERGSSPIREKEKTVADKPLVVEQAQAAVESQKVEVVPVVSEIDKLVKRSEQLALLAKRDREKIPELVSVYRKILSIDKDRKIAVSGIAGFRKNALSPAEKSLKSGSLSSAKKELSSAILLFPELGQDKKYQELNRRLSKNIRVEKLLAKGAENFSKDRLAAPPGNNAEEDFKGVLAIDSSNKKARLGLEKIVERFISLADAAKAQMDYEGSLGFANNGLRIDAKNETLQSLSKELQVLTLDKQKIDQLLVEAVEFEKQQLLFGEGDNAAQNYRKVLAMDSSNAFASAGLAEIRNYSFSLLTELTLKKDFDLAQSTLQSALISFPGDETLIGMRMELDENRPVIESLIISGIPFSDHENAAQPQEVAVERTLFLVLNYSGFEQAATVLQVILWDGGRSRQIAAKPIVITGDSGSYQFEIDRAVEGFSEGGYHIDILQSGKNIYSLAFVIGQ